MSEARHIALQLACEHGATDVCATPPASPEPRMKSIAEQISEAIQERRDRIAHLELEVQALESAAGVLGAAPVPLARVKPPPAVREAKPVRAEKKPKPVRGTLDPAAFGCGHPRTAENSDVGSYVKKDGSQSTNCRTCRVATQKRARDKKAGKVAEPDPVLVERSKLVEVKSPGNGVAATNAARWQGQCPMLDSGTGKRCSLPSRHDGLHSASGRTFSAAAAVNLAAMGGLRRELDEQALRGSGA